MLNSLSFLKHQPFLEASSAAFAATKANIELSLKTFQELVTFFGEDAARITPKAFFGYIVEFSNLFRRFVTDTSTFAKPQISQRDG